MSIKTEYETYRWVGEICRLKGQSVVEVRLAGSEISTVLAVQAKAVAQESACADGEAHYNGKLILSIVYEDGEKKVCRAERGAEFFHKIEGSAVTPACFCKTALTAETVNIRREGSGLYVSVVIGAEIEVYGGKQIDYVTGGEGLITKKEKTTVFKTVCVSGETEGEDEFESDYVGDVLLHSEKAIVGRVVAEAGQIEIEGELALNICVLKADDGVCSYERLIPFRMQIPSDEAFGRLSAGARVDVKSARLDAGADEEKGKCKMVLSYVLSADCYLSVKEELDVVADAFSTVSEVVVKSANDGGRYLTKCEKYTERVGGSAQLTPSLEGEYTLQACVLPRAEVICKKTENGTEAEGAVFADVILVSADGAHRKAELCLPFLFPVDIEGEIVEADALVCGLNVRRKRGGETEAEATLKLCFKAYAEGQWAYVSDVLEGEPFKEGDPAFSVFLTKEGEDLWAIAKRLKCEPSALEKSNPNLEFPLQAGQRIYVYKPLKKA